VNQTILITGGTGRLGRHVVAALRSRGHELRILSRQPGPGHMVGDLATGAGVPEALDGVDTVVHLATSRSKDIGHTKTLLDAMAGSDTHLIFTSIVGVDRIPFPYYRDKVASEQAIEASDVPFTIIRVTQFHGFVHELLERQRRMPVTLTLPVSAQTIHMPEVAERLASLAEARPAGRVADLGGPQQLTGREYARDWQQAVGIERPIWALHLPGKTMKGFREGHQMPGLPGAGHVTFRQYLEGDR
jgi:uncharacterized protein YbjT (DUF2867 family)